LEHMTMTELNLTDGGGQMLADMVKIAELMR
jgi:hypothetical protein